MRVVVAVKDLAKVPHAVDFAIRGLSTDIVLKVLGWDHYNNPTNLPADPTPPPAYFQQVQNKLFKQPLIEAQPDTSPTMIPVDADVLFDWWSKLEEGEHKQGIEKMLRASPFWAVKEKRDIVHSLLGRAVTTNQSAVPTTEQSAQQLVLRGSSSSAPAPAAVELGISRVPLTQLPNRELVENTLTGGTIEPDLPSPTPTPPRFNSNHNLPAQTEHQPNTSNTSNPPFTSALVETSATQAVPQNPNTSHSALTVIAQRPNNSKRPADNPQGNSSAKRSLDRALLSSEDKDTPLDTQAEPQQKLVDPNQSSALRRSTRKAKGNATLAPFVVGSTVKKPRAPKLKQDTVKEALITAELERCLDKESIVSDPLSQEERDRIKLFCGVLEEPTKAQEDTITT